MANCAVTMSGQPALPSARLKVGCNIIEASDMVVRDRAMQRAINRPAAAAML